ncbi:MAG: hypothetical protein AAGH15_02465, partial [Myxococcota bacterium]
MRPLALAFLLVLTGSLLGRADAPRVAALEARYGTAAEAPERDLAQGALHQARRALDGGATGEPSDARERRLAIADAALELAERQIARERAAAGRREAETLRVEAAQRLVAA